MEQIAQHELLQRFAWLSGKPSAPHGLRVAPSPPADPIAGHYRFLAGDFLTYLHQARERHGDVVRLQFGPIQAHIIADPSLIQRVHLDQRQSFGKNTRGTRALKLVLGDGLLTSQGERWLRNRRLAQPAFHKRRLSDFGVTFVRIASDMADELRDGDTVDAHALLNALALRVVSHTLLGSDVGGREREVAAAVDHIAAQVVRRTRRAIPLVQHLFVADNLRFEKHLENLDEIVFEMIRARRASGDPGEDLLGRLMVATDPETGTQLDDKQLRDEVMTMFLAGHETTANALSWAYHLLGRHIGSRQRMLDEIDQVLEGRTPTWDDVPKLVYTRRVVDETMRLYPPAWMLARSADEETELGGYHIPRGSMVVTPPWVVHRHPSHWEYPEGFYPDHFLPDAARARHRYAYIPFGGGPRLCIGKDFALYEAVLVLATLSQRLVFERIPGEEVALQPEVTLRPRGGMPMRVRLRR